MKISLERDTKDFMDFRQSMTDQLAIQELIDLIASQTRKNGNLLLNQGQINLLQKFRNFDIAQDWIESKELTKIEKILIKHIPNVIEVRANNPRIHIGIWSMLDFDPERILESTKKYRDDKLTKSDKEILNRIADNCRQLIDPLRIKFQYMRQYRCMINGKLPKAAREQQQREAIKGELSPVLLDELEAITDGFKEIMLKFYKKHFEEKAERAVKFFHNTPTPKRGEYGSKERQKYNDFMNTARYYSEVMAEMKSITPKPVIELHKLAEQVTNQQGDNFFFKMADKLGGLITDTNLSDAHSKMIGSSTAMNSRMHFSFKNGSRFTIENKIVLNHSPLGTPFYQYPCTFHDVILPSGRKLDNPSEESVKRFFNVRSEKA